MIIILIFLFVGIVVISFLPDKNKVDALLLFILVGCCMILTSSFRGENVDRDYLSYKQLFFTDGFDISVEITFLLIKSFIKLFLFNNFIILLFIYAFLGIGLKFYGIQRITKFWFASILIYFGNLFIIQDLTQIRAGVCSALLLISIIPLYNNQIKPFFLVAFVAVLFHYSGLIVFLLWFLDAHKINKKLWALVIPISYMAFFMHLNIVSVSKLLPIPMIQAKLDVYLALQDSLTEAKVNLFSILILIRCTFIYFFLYKIGFLTTKNKFSIILLKIYIMSVGILIISSDISTVAFRLNELLSVSEIILVPLLIYLFKPKLLGHVIVVVFAIMLFYFQFRAHTLLIF